MTELFILGAQAAALVLSLHFIAARIDRYRSRRHLRARLYGRRP